MTSYYARTYYDGDGANRLFAVTFPYINAADVHLQVGGVDVSFVWINSAIVQANIAPGVGVGNVAVKRITPGSVVSHTIQTGSIRPADINEVDTQLLYLIQELTDELASYGLANIAAQLATAIATANNAVNLANAALAAIAAAGLGGALHYTSAVVTVSTLMSAAIETYFVNAAGATTQTLPVAPGAAEKHIIKDMGANAGTNRITISGNGKNIDGQASWFIDSDRGFLAVQYNGTEWSVIS